LKQLERKLKETVEKRQGKWYHFIITIRERDGEPGIYDLREKDEIVKAGILEKDIDTEIEKWKDERRVRRYMNNFIIIRRVDSNPLGKEYERETEKTRATDNGDGSTTPETA
jgi:hypothetical protein